MFKRKVLSAPIIPPAVMIPTFEESREVARKALEREWAGWGQPMDAEAMVPQEAERQFAKLRPMSFDQFTGQKRHVERIKAAVNTSIATGKPMPHMAFISEAGMGKTSLAACCATELGKTALATVGSALHSLDDVADLVRRVKGGIVFIDEAHDLARNSIPIVSGMLPLLEDWVIHASAGSIYVEPFTCIMATTSFGMLDRALRSRMGIPYEFDDYSISEMVEIALYHADKNGIDLEEDAAREIGRRARGNPRYCLNLTRECHNRAISSGLETITSDACIITFQSLAIDDEGLSNSDCRLLELLASGACSITRCAAYLGLDKQTYEETVEAFLFRQGYITIGSKGRALTQKGREYLEGTYC